MYKDKFSFIELILLIISTILNFLIYLNIVPFTVWRIQNNTLVILVFIVVLFQKKSFKNKISKKSVPLTICGFIICSIYIFLEFSILINSL